MDGVVLTPTLQHDLETAILWKEQKLLNSVECKDMREVAFSANRQRHLMPEMEEEMETAPAAPPKQARAPILVRVPSQKTRVRRAEAVQARMTGVAKPHVGRGRLPQRNSSERVLPEVLEGGRRVRSSAEIKLFFS